jgi:large subunit ribosomal protein L20
MARIKRSQSRKQRKKTIRKWVKGFFGARKRYRQAKEAIMFAQRNAFAGRKAKKRHFRSLWITRISAALMPHRLSYSRFMHGLKVASVDVNRKSLANLALIDPSTFDALVARAREALA